MENPLTEAAQLLAESSMNTGPIMGINENLGEVRHTMVIIEEIEMENNPTTAAVAMAETEKKEKVATRKLEGQGAQHTEVEEAMLELKEGENEAEVVVQTSLRNEEGQITADVEEEKHDEIKEGKSNCDTEGKGSEGKIIIDLSSKTVEEVATRISTSEQDHVSIDLQESIQNLSRPALQKIQSDSNLNRLVLEKEGNKDMGIDDKRILGGKGRTDQLTPKNLKIGKKFTVSSNKARIKGDSSMNLRSKDVGTATKQSSQ